MLQSALLGVLAAVIASRSRRLTLPLLALVVLLHQALILVPQLLRDRSGPPSPPSNCGCRASSCRSWGASPCSGSWDVSCPGLG
jgi:hypothetical protein